MKMVKGQAGFEPAVDLAIDGLQNHSPSASRSLPLAEERGAVPTLPSYFISVSVVLYLARSLTPTLGRQNSFVVAFS